MTKRFHFFHPIPIAVFAVIALPNLYLGDAQAESAAISNARLSADVKADTLGVAEQISQSLKERAALSSDIARNLKSGPLSPSNSQALSINFGDAIANSADSHPKQAAKLLDNVAKQAGALSARLDNVISAVKDASPAQATNLISASISQHTIAAIFPNSPLPAGAFAPTPAKNGATVDIHALAPMIAGNTKNAGYSVGFENVAMLLYRPANAGDYSPTCTGTLVAPNKIVTAAHCFCPYTGTVRALVTPGSCETANLLPLTQNFRVFFQHAGLFDVDNVKVNPAFEIGAKNGAPVDRGDVAVVTLSKPVTGFAFATLAQPSTGIGAGYRSTVVGFGQSYILTAIAQRPVSITNPGLKASSSVTLSGCTSPFDDAFNYCWSSGANGSGTSGAICPGDSGGPMFPLADGDAIGSGNNLIGVTSARLTDDCTPATSEGDSMVVADTNRLFLQQEITGVTSPTGTMAALFAKPDLVLDLSGLWRVSLLVGGNPHSITVTANGPDTAGLMLRVTDTNASNLCSPDGGSANGIPSSVACTITQIPGDKILNIQVLGVSSSPFQFVAAEHS